MTTTTKSDLLSVSEISDKYPISVPTIWRQLKAARFPEPVRVGRRCYWLREDVMTYFTPQSKRA